MAVLVNFGAMVVNNITNASGVFFGENAQQGWFSPSKSNQGQRIYGISCISINNININNDQDCVDTPSIDNNMNIPAAPVILKVT